MSPWFWFGLLTSSPTSSATSSCAWLCIPRRPRLCRRWWAPRWRWSWSGRSRPRAGHASRQWRRRSRRALPELVRPRALPSPPVVEPGLRSAFALSSRPGQRHRARPGAFQSRLSPRGRRVQASAALPHHRRLRRQSRRGGQAARLAANLPLPADQAAQLRRTGTPRRGRPRGLSMTARIASRADPGARPRAGLRARGLRLPRRRAASRRLPAGLAGRPGWAARWPICVEARSCALGPRRCCPGRARPSWSSPTTAAADPARGGRARAPRRRAGRSLRARTRLSPDHRRPPASARRAGPAWPSAPHAGGGRHPAAARARARRRGRARLHRQEHAADHARPGLVTPASGCCSPPTSCRADPRAREGCGRCRLCLEACPTRALCEPYLLDARRCVAALTIEQRGPLAGELLDGVAPWVFGCNRCQEVCPFNARPRPGTDPDLARAHSAQRSISSSSSPCAARATAGSCAAAPWLAPRA